MGMHDDIKVPPAIHNRIKAPPGIRRRVSREQTAPSFQQGFDLDYEAVQRLIEYAREHATEAGVDRTVSQHGDPEDEEAAKLRVRLSEVSTAVMAILRRKLQSTSQVIEGRTTVPDAAPPPSNQAREYVGFDREKASFDRAKPDLLRTAEGQFVVFVGEEMAGPFPGFRDALRAGYGRFGLGPLYIKQVREEEQAVDLGLPS